MKSRAVRVSLLLCALLGAFVLISLAGTRGFTRTGSTPPPAPDANQSGAIDQFPARRAQSRAMRGAVKEA